MLCGKADLLDVDPVEGLHLAVCVGVDEFGNTVQPLDPAFQWMEESIPRLVLT